MGARQNQEIKNSEPRQGSIWNPPKKPISNPPKGFWIHLSWRLEVPRPWTGFLNHQIHVEIPKNSFLEVVGSMWNFQKLSPSSQGSMFVATCCRDLQASSRYFWKVTLSVTLGSVPFVVVTDEPHPCTFRI